MSVDAWTQLEPCLHHPRVVQAEPWSDSGAIAEALRDGYAVASLTWGAYRCICDVAEVTMTLCSTALAEAAKAAHARGGLTGVRAWDILYGTLRSLVYTGAWRAQMGNAECAIGHRAPDPDCACGYYAVTPEAANSLLDLVGVGRAAIGVVEPRGRVVVGEHGWRAERAIIREVWTERRLYETLDLALYPDVTWHLYEEVA